MKQAVESNLKSFEFFYQTLGSIWSILMTVEAAVNKYRKDFKYKTAALKVSNLVWDTLARVKGMMGGIVAANLSSQKEELLKQKRQPHRATCKRDHDPPTAKRSWSSVVHNGETMQSEPIS